MGFLRQIFDPDKAPETPTRPPEFANNLAHAALVTSTIPKGIIGVIDSTRAKAAPGVVAIIITHRNAQHLNNDPRLGEQLRVLQTSEISFCGQPIAVVIAEASEQAREAAALIQVTYDPAKPISQTRENGASWQAVPPETGRTANQAERGDVERAMRYAAVTIANSYFREREEGPRATIAIWEGDRLTLHDRTRWIGHDTQYIANALGVRRENIRVVPDGLRNGTSTRAPRAWHHITVVALAARQLGRPVSLELTRHEIWAAAGLWSGIEQRITLAAARDGRLQAILHEAPHHEAAAATEISQGNLGPEEDGPKMLEAAHVTYSCANVRTSYIRPRALAIRPIPCRAQP